MIIHWALFLPGLLLLVFPADRLLSSAVQLRNFESFRSLENSPRHRPWWWLPVLWIDPLRGFIGTLALKHALVLDSPDWVLAPKPGYWLMIGILGLAVLIQTFTRRDEDVMLAPIGFVAGIVAALTPWPVALIGLAMGLTGLFAFRKFHAFFSVGVATVGCLGFMLDATLMWLVPAGGVLALPMLACVVTGREMELPTRNASGPHRRQMPA